MTIVVTPTVRGPIVVGIGKPDIIDIEVGTSGKQGKPGEPGPEGGTPVVAVPYNQWPPVNPVPDTLYLRLAP
jgi:hypothetical protein